MDEGKREDGRRTLLEALKEDYENGRFDLLRQSLEHFIRSRRGRILEKAEEMRERFCDINEERTRLELAVKKSILESRVLNPLIEAREQMREIERHIWLEGVKLNRPPDREKAAREWLGRWAKSWREYRLFAALYVFEREMDRFLAVLLGEDGRGKRGEDAPEKGGDGA